MHFQIDERDMNKSMSWSCLASRILLPLTSFKIFNDMELYFAVQAINWPNLFTFNETFAVYFYEERTKLSVIVSMELYELRTL